MEENNNQERQNLKDNQISRGIKDRIKKKIKSKMLMFVIANLGVVFACILFLVFLITTIYIIQKISPVLNALGKVSEISRNINNFFSQDDNLMTNRDFYKEDEERVREVESKIQEKLSETYNEYVMYVPDIDMPLIASTVFYPLTTTYQEEEWSIVNEDKSWISKKIEIIKDWLEDRGIIKSDAEKEISKNIKDIEELAHYMVRKTKHTYKCQCFTDAEDNTYCVSTFIRSDEIDSTTDESYKWPKDESCDGDKIYYTYSFDRDYDKYKKYLREVYIPENPEYKLPDHLSDGELEIKKGAMIDNIFKQTDYIARMIRLGSYFGGPVLSFTGLTSLPIQIAPGENWRDKISRGYSIAGATCYKDGKPTGEHNCPHQAIDFSYSGIEGTPVVAIADADVLDAVTTIKNGYGYYVELGHDTDGDGVYDYYSLYAHLSLVTVKTGDKIGGGEKIGEVGNTGNSSGPHLHFEIKNKNGNKIDPSSILDSIQNGDLDNNPLSGIIPCGMGTVDLNLLNTGLSNAVSSAGFATREGVVAAANFLTSKKLIPYFWGGKYTATGFNQEWGCQKQITSSGSSRQPLGSTHPYGLDCSGFVAWALKNGGYKNITDGDQNQSNLTTEKVLWNISNINLIKPGDLAWKPGHIGIVVEVNTNGCKIKVAEATSKGVRNVDYTCNTGYSYIVLMDDYYNNTNNKEI